MGLDPSLYLTGEAPSYTAPDRYETYVYELVDVQSLERTGVLSRVLSCNLDWDENADVRGTGRMSVVLAPGETLDRQLIRVWIVVGELRQQMDNWGNILDPVELNRATMLGTYYHRTMAKLWENGNEVLDIDLFDRTVVAKNRQLSATHSIPVNTKLTDALGGIFERLQLFTVELTPAPDKPWAAMIWSPVQGEITWLQVANDILDALGYSRMYAKPNGTLVCEPLKDLSYRETNWVLSDDRKNTMGVQYKEGASITSSLYGAPNEWILWSKANGTTPPQMASSRNLNPSHPNSVSRVGMVVSKRISDVDTSSLTALQLKANRLRDKEMKEQLSWEIESRYFPGRERDAVTVVHTGSKTKRRAIITKRSLLCKPGGLLKLTLREE